MSLRKCLLECRDETLVFYQSLRSIWLLFSIMFSLLVILFISKGVLNVSQSLKTSEYKGVTQMRSLKKMLRKILRKHLQWSSFICKVEALKINCKCFQWLLLNFAERFTVGHLWTAASCMCRHVIKTWKSMKR